MSAEKMSVTYSRGKRSITVRVPTGRDPCIVCGATREEKKLDRHHWKEVFSFKQVKENHLLALENSIPACFHHHNLANAIREIVSQLQRGNVTMDQLLKLIDSMPSDMKETWDELVARTEVPSGLS